MEPLTREKIDEMSSAEIKKELVKIIKKLGNSDFHFHFKPETEDTHSFESVCKIALLFLLELEKSKEVGENDFDL